MDREARLVEDSVPREAGGGALSEDLAEQGVAAVRVGISVQ